VKIKITEYFPGAKAIMGTDFPSETPPAIDNPFASGHPTPIAQGARPLSVLRSNDKGLADQPGDNGERYYTIQRVNGNGANGKGDGTAGAHKHTIEDSDRVKKSSIHRQFLKEEKERRKSLVRVSPLEVSIFALALRATFQTARDYARFMHIVSGVGHADISSLYLLNIHYPFRITRHSLPLDYLSLQDSSLHQITDCHQTLT